MLRIASFDNLKEYEQKNTRHLCSIACTEKKRIQSVATDLTEMCNIGFNWVAENQFFDLRLQFDFASFQLF